MNTSNQTTGQRIVQYLKSHVMYLVLIALLLFFATQNPKFLSWGNLRNIVNQSAYQVIVGVGLVFVMIAGAMDLSVGYQMSFAGVIMGKLLNDGWSIPLVLLVGILSCILMNLLNCFLCIKFNVFPFILTLATQYLFMGLSYIWSGSKTFLNFPDQFKSFGQGYVGPVPIAVIIMVIAVIFASFVLNKTYFGRQVYAVGGNMEAATLAGINVNKVKYIIYIIAGFFVGLGTIILISRSGSAASSVGPGTEFTIIAGGILGGISLKGGSGKISCIVLGVLILTVLSNGMQLMQLDVYPQYVAKGIVLIIAIGFDSYQKIRFIKRSKQVAGRPPEAAEQKQ